MACRCLLSDPLSRADAIEIMWQEHLLADAQSMSRPMEATGDDSREQAENNDQTSHNQPLERTINLPNLNCAVGIFGRFIYPSQSSTIGVR
jgi:hypothetical protein